MKTAEEKFRIKTRYDLVKRTKAENYLFLNKTATKSGQTVLIGDSITEIFNTYELFYTYSAASGQAVYNRGISGDTSDRLAERLADNALNIAPRNLVILIGTNDLGNKLPLDFTVRHVKQCLQMTRERCPQTHVVLEGVYPVNRSMSAAAHAMVGSRRNRDIVALNAQLQLLALEEGAQFLDLTARLADEKGRLQSAYCYDGLHLNAQGFQVVAEALVPCLR